MNNPQYETFAINGLLAKRGHNGDQSASLPSRLKRHRKNLGSREEQNSCKNVTFKQRDVQQLAEGNFAAVTKEEWAAVCRHVRAVGCT